MKEPKITVRANANEYQEIRRRAEAANMSVNRYLIEAALRPMPGNDKQLSALMGQLCSLELCVQRAAELHSLKKDVNNWRQMTMRLMEGN
ncbi:MAG: plasmid mobilization protein [Oscillospiraceae bacterium]